jgi:outer membrane protein OmpA-like peptidoglycan-associated protein
VKQPAHYQHVYVESSDPSATSLKTITLRDAVYSDVLASSDLKVQKINKDRLNWLVMGAAPKQPTEIEGVGGFDVISNNNVEVNFDTDKTDILNLANLQPLVQKASRVSGTFYVVGYADETGIEQKNELLSQNRAQSVVSVLVSAGVNRTRIIDAGAGVSTLYTELALNRRAAVSFYVDE